MTEAELAGPRGFNCPKLAKLALPDLECQDHHLPSARAAGVKLYLAAHTGCPHTLRFPVGVRGPSLPPVMSHPDTRPCPACHEPPPSAL